MFVNSVYFLLIQFGTVKPYVSWHSSATETDIKRFSHITRTTWPSQHRYSSLHISNLNEYIQLFEHCLINIENYQGIDVSETKIPVLVTRLDIKITRCNKSVISREIHYGKISTVQEICKNYTLFYKHFQLPLEYKLTAGRWSCFAKFELFLPEIKEAPHIFKFKHIYGNKEFFVPYNNLYEDSEPGITNCCRKSVFFVMIWNLILGFLGAFSQPSYYLLVHTQNTSVQLRQFWNTQMLDTISPKFENIWRFHLKIEKLGVGIVRSISVSHVSIVSMHLVFAFCSPLGGDIVVSISPNRWLEETNQLSDFNFYLPVIVDTTNFKRKNFLVEKFSLQHLLFGKYLYETSLKKHSNNCIIKCPWKMLKFYF